MNARNDVQTMNAKPKRLLSALLAAAGVVAAAVLSGCVSTNSLSTSPTFAAYKDRIVYMRVFGFQDDPLFGYEGAIRNLCSQGDSRCQNKDDYLMVWGMPRNSYWDGNVKFYSMIPKHIPVQRGDIIEIRMPDANRPTYFLRVVARKDETDPVCFWEGLLTSGGVVCPKFGYDYRKHLGIKGIRPFAGGYSTYPPEPYTPPAWSYEKWPLQQAKAAN